MGFEAGDGEDAGADDGAEAEPDKVPPVEALVHVVLAGLAELHQLEGVGGAVEEAVPKAGAGVGECGLVRCEALERGFWEEVLLAPSPVASTRRLWVLLLRPHIHAGGSERGWLGCFWFRETGKDLNSDNRQTPLIWV